MISNLPNEHTDWENLSSKLKELQDKWNSIGPVPKKVNNEMWKSFRSQYVTFYNAKKEFYNNRNTIQKEFAAQKKALIAKAEAITCLLYTSPSPRD